MIIRKYEPEDCKEIIKLFYDTVHTINAKDYTKEQLDAWATGKEEPGKWDRLFCEHYSIVALCDGIIVGFGDIDKTGYLDKLYVHKDYQRKGVASALCSRLEEAAEGKIVTHASVTAKPFFEKRGYIAIREQEVERHGIFLKNFVMEKYKKNKKKT